MGFCGLDFGTSNSTLGIVQAGAPKLVGLEDGKPTIPSAMFYGFEDRRVIFGRAAMEAYIDGEEGRLMRALKSLLGSPLMLESTPVPGRGRVAFTDVLGTFLGHLKALAEAEAGEELERVVLGRPVHFVDDNKDADMRAQGQLEAAARSVGFRDIGFQYEPIAAALDYERQVRAEEVALIVDIGGGTSDFSIVRVSPERAKATDRGADILANAGVHVGGTDFDRLLNLASVMPHLGYGTLDESGKYELPRAYYTDLATWQRINWLYVPKVMSELKRVHYSAMYPHLVERLMAVLEARQGHALAAQVERAKITLTHEDRVPLPVRLGDEMLDLVATRADFDTAIDEAAGRVRDTVTETLAQAGLEADGIGAVFLTGGSTQIPLVKEGILGMLPGAKVVEGDMFGSVGLGLAVDAGRRFG